MADIAVTTAGLIDIVESIQQMDLPAGEAIVAGAPVRINTAGKFVNGNGQDATESAIYGIAVASVAADMPVTAIKQGVLGGITFSQAYGALIYVSDTDARLGDAAGTVEVIVGRIVPGTATSTYGKLLSVDL
jgi:hypothetical protein